jgi:hypothetical protein
MISNPRWIKLDEIRLFHNSSGEKSSSSKWLPVAIRFHFSKHRFHILHSPNSTGLFTKPTGRHYTKYRFSPDIAIEEYTSNEWKQNRKVMSTCNWLDLESLGSWPTKLYMPKTSWALVPMLLRNSLPTQVNLAKKLQSCTVVSGMHCMRRLLQRKANFTSSCLRVAFTSRSHFQEQVSREQSCFVNWRRWNHGFSSKPWVHEN